MTVSAEFLEHVKKAALENQRKQPPYCPWEHQWEEFIRAIEASGLDPLEILGAVKGHVVARKEAVVKKRRDYTGDDPAEKKQWDFYSDQLADLDVAEITLTVGCDRISDIKMKMEQGGGDHER